MNAFGIVGKLPSDPEFLHLGGAQASHTVADWLHAQVQELGRKRSEAFGFALNMGERRVFGTVQPSADSVGRAFPCACFVECSAAENWEQQLASALGHGVQTASAWQEVLDGAWSPKLERSLEAWVTAIPDPPAAKASPFWPGVGGEALSAGERAYALTCALQALEEHKSKGKARHRALACKLGNAAHLGFWCRLWARLGSMVDPEGPRGALGMPDLAWNGRYLVLHLGGASPKLLGHVADPNFDPQLWPLWTQVAQARRSALESLADEFRYMLEDDFSV